MNVNNFFCFILSCWDFSNQIASYNAIDIFENLTTGWNFLELQCKDYWYWTIFLEKFNKNINKKFIQIQNLLGNLESSC
jgi:hypothetical protein